MYKAVSFSSISFGFHQPLLLSWGCGSPQPLIGASLWVLSLWDAVCAIVSWEPGRHTGTLVGPPQWTGVCEMAHSMLVQSQGGHSCDSLSGAFSQAVSEKLRWEEVFTWKTLGSYYIFFSVLWLNVPGQSKEVYDFLFYGKHHPQPREGGRFLSFSWVQKSVICEISIFCGCFK